MEFITREDLLERFGRFVDEQVATGRQGTRQIEFSLDERMRITSIKGVECPPRPKRLPPATRELT